MKGNKMDDEFLKDVANEKAFLEEVTKFQVANEEDNNAGITSELSEMIKAYNEQLSGMIRARFDVEIFSNLIIAEPNDASHSEGKAKSLRALELRRMSIRVLRGQIVEVIKAMAN